mgnify:CR=1 FL=1
MPFSPEDPALMKRHPQRVAVTVSNAVYVSLNHVANAQGRSNSNLAAYLIERGLEDLASSHPE